MSLSYKERTEPELLDLVQLLKLQVPFDSSITQKHGKSPKFSGRSAVNVLLQHAAMLCKSTGEAEYILSCMQTSNFLEVSQRTAVGASPSKGKVHYRFNDKLIIEHSAKKRTSLSRDSLNSFPLTQQEEPVMTQTTTLTNENDGRDRRTMFKRFASGFVAMYALSFLEFSWSSGSDDMSMLRRFVSISVLTLVSIAVTSRKKITSETSTVTVPLHAAKDFMSGTRSTTDAPTLTIQKTSNSATSYVYNVSEVDAQRLRSDLFATHPKELKDFVLSDTYMKSVLSQPNSKNKSERRTIEYAGKKLETYLDWRERTGVDKIMADKDKGELARHFAEGAVYWHGVDKAGRPILWERFGAMDWTNFDSGRKVKMITLLFEAIFRAMPEGVSQFTVVASVEGMPYRWAITKPNFFLGCAKLFVQAFPDRLGMFLCMSDAVIQFMLRVIKPVLPASVSTKMSFPAKFNEHVAALVGEELIPDWCGGQAVHPENIRVNFDDMMAGVTEAMRG